MRVESRWWHSPRISAEYGDNGSYLIIHSNFEGSDGYRRVCIVEVGVSPVGATPGHFVSGRRYSRLMPAEGICAWIAPPLGEWNATVSHRPPPSVASVWTTSGHGLC